MERLSYCRTDKPQAQRCQSACIFSRPIPGSRSYLQAETRQESRNSPNARDHGKVGLDSCGPRSPLRDKRGPLIKGASREQAGGGDVVGHL